MSTVQPNSIFRVECWYHISVSSSSSSSSLSHSLVNQCIIALLAADSLLSGLFGACLEASCTLRSCDGRSFFHLFFNVSLTHSLDCLTSDGLLCPSDCTVTGHVPGGICSKPNVDVQLADPSLLGITSWTFPFRSVIRTVTSTYSLSQKIPPKVFWHFFPKWLGIFSPNFTRLLYIPVYARLQICIQLPATLTKLCHIKCAHPVHIICSKCPPSAETHTFRRLRKSLIALLIIVCGKSSQICCSSLFSAR